jgi:hypothetical protein
LAAALQKKLNKHQVHGLDKFIAKSTANSVSPEARRATEAEPPLPPAAAAASQPMVAARVLRSISDTDAVSTSAHDAVTSHTEADSASAGANPPREDGSAPSLQHPPDLAVSSSSSSSSSSSDSNESDWDATGAAAAAPLAADGAATAVSPPPAMQPLQFARRALGAGVQGAASPRTAPHASPRFNPSLTPRSQAASDGRLYASATDSSSSDGEVQLQAAPVSSERKMKSVPKDPAAVQQQLPQRKADSPPGAAHAALHPGPTPGAIISRQPSAAEEHENEQQQQQQQQQQQRVVSSKANWGHPRPQPAAVSANSVPPAAAAPPVDDNRLSVPEKAHTRCRCVAPLPCHSPSLLAAAASSPCPSCAASQACAPAWP